MHALAQGKGGKCLSTTYVYSRTKLEWECQKGHRWFAVPFSVKVGNWCRKCAGVEKNTIEDMHSLAHARGGKCLATVYVNTQTKLEWECQKGHCWFAVPMAVKRGNWCRKCAGVEKKTIEEMQDLAVQRGGKCLSTEYKNVRTHLVWECALGHQWKATPRNIQQGRWCPHCAGNQLKTLKDMQILASENGGRCLSDTYINSRTKLLWKCRSGHRWWAAPDIIQQGRWCEICRRRSKGSGAKNRVPI